ncbi:hypothetical protein C882_0829 [Caenispirillum salinarum AK4]|uniref:Uncharacterized protein n=2 Tax=Caenispirillum TaxID=414051 RepID=K9HDR2_9PROT|nr:hypothetical protein C882_0829 [Caenispirillum salinarum AK4]
MLNGFRDGLSDRLASFGTDAAEGSAAEGESSMPATLILVALASIMTVLWVFGAWSAVVPEGGLGALAAEAVPAALAAVAAPPAILWLALTVWTAAVTARRSERAMRAVLHHTRRSTEQSEVQVRTLLQMQEDSRRARMLEGLDEALADLRCSLALIAERTGLLSADDTELAWARTAAGDRWAFANAFLTPWAYQPDLPEILGERVAQAPEAAAALQTYLRRWRRLLAVLSENEADKLLRETLEDGPADRLYTFLLRVEQSAVGVMQNGEPAASGGSGPANGSGHGGTGRGNGNGSGARYVASAQDMAPEPEALLATGDGEAADAGAALPPLFEGMGGAVAARSEHSGGSGDARPTVN